MSSSNSISKGQRATSIKTRIETVLNNTTSSIEASVREQHPLKQGLRPFSDTTSGFEGVGQRATSIKTRIETHCNAFLRKAHHRQRATSIKTRIETYTDLGF